MAQISPPPTPDFFVPKPTPSGQSYNPAQTHTPANNNSGQFNSQKIIQQRQQAAQQMGTVTPTLQRSKELQAVLNEDKDGSNTTTSKSLNYKQAYIELIQMLNGQTVIDFKRAVFITENAYTDNTMQYEQFCKRINSLTSLCKKIISKEKLTDSKIARNYAIQKLFTDTIREYRPDGSVKYSYPLHYDFNDFYGEKDWKQMFVSKLLRTKAGQCHSMPLLTKILADELGTDAYLSYAPEHLYIKFKDASGALYNFETTNGMNTTDSWIIQSGYLSSVAVKNRLYMDTLSAEQNIALCLSDLAQGYIQKYGYDDFALQCIESVLQHDPNNIHALMLQADLYTIIAGNILKHYGNPPLSSINQYPEAAAALNAMNKAYSRIDNSGYQPMPKEAYEEWLKSLDSEKQKQENKDISHTILQQIHQ